jgi:hypothetical protein
LELGKIERAFMNNIVRRWFLRNLEARVFYRYLIKRNVIVYNPDAILEIGCGRGDGIAIHEKFYHPKIHHAFDIDQKLVALALRNINNSDFEHVKIYRCDVRAIKEPDMGCYIIPKIGRLDLKKFHEFLNLMEFIVGKNLLNILIICSLANYCSLIPMLR